MTDDAQAHSALEGFPLSPQQRYAWDRQTDDADVDVRLRVSGASDAAVRRALADVVDRFEILRTSFERLPGMAAPLQVIHDGVPILWQTEGEQADDPSDRPAETDRAASGPGLRAELRRVNEDEAVVELHLSALQADAASAVAIAEAFRDALRGTEPDQEPLQYADLADWLNDALDGEAADDGQAFWSAQGTAAPGTWLPATPPTDAETGRAAVPVRSFSDVQALCDHFKASPQAVALTVWGGLLNRLVAGDPVPVCVGFDGRAYEELAGALGPLTRSAPIAMPTPEAPLGEAVRAVQTALEDGASWQDTFDPTAETGSPFSFSWFEAPTPDAAGGATVTVDDVEAPPASRVELVVTVGGTAPQARVVYDRQALAPDDAERLAGQYAVLLAEAAAHPEAALSGLPFLTGADRRTLDAFAASGPAPEPAHATLHALVEATSTRTPDATAVVGPGGDLSYADLEARANQLARHLRDLGVEAETRVALLLDRSVDAVVAILATLKAGGAYVPVDPDYPADRVAFMLVDANVRVVVTQSVYAASASASGAAVVALDRDAEAIASHNPAPLATDGQTEAAAYVIYTSGSTGRPKGVVVEHRQAVYSTTARFEVYAEPVGAYLLLPSFAFDSSVAGLFWTLSTGGTLVIPSSDAAADPSALASLVRSHDVTHLLAVPSLYGLLLDTDAERLRSLRTCIVAGEACPPSVVERHAVRLPQAHLFNEYGPTEVTVWASVYDTASWPDNQARTATVPIGRPIPGTRLLLLDAGGQPVPPGVAGEIYVGGPGVARGYLDRPDLTADRFVDGPDSGRLYRTGDLGRFLADGTLLFLGRTDDQVKIRGYRIELGEIEAVLSEHEGVAEAAVAVRKDASGESRLIAAVVPDARTAGPVRSSLHADAPRALYELPNGLRVAHLNRAETDYIYDEIFEDQSYLRHGVTVQKGAVVFDVGANVGLFSLLISLSVPDAQVYAFEPIPDTFRALKANAALYGHNVRPFEVALSQETGEAEFSYFPHVSLVSGRYADGPDEREAIRAFLRQSPALGDGAPPSEDQLNALLDSRLERRPVRVQTRTLSDVIREEGIDRIDLLKVDVEKSEVDVLEGVDPLDWPKIQQVTMEVQDTGGALNRVRSILTDNGFEVAVEQEVELGDTPLVKVYGVRGTTGAAPTRLSPVLPTWTDADTLAGDLQAHNSRRVPSYMVPDAVVFMTDLPRTPNGKLDRDALPAAPAPEVGGGTFRPPAAGTEERLARVWSSVLGLDRVGADDDFFDLGGHSILAIKLFARVEAEFGAAPPLATLFSAPTVARLAPFIDDLTTSEGTSTLDLGPSLVPLQPLGDRPPLFCFHEAANDLFLYSAIARAMGGDQPVYHVVGQGADGRGIAHTSLRGMALDYLDQIRAVQPEGPYMFAGYCIGGRLAMEVARLVRERGDEVGLLAMIESAWPEEGRLPARREKYAQATRQLLSRSGRASFDPRSIGRWLTSGLGNRARDAADRLHPAAAHFFLGRGDAVPSSLRDEYVRDTYHRVMYATEIAPYAGDVVLVRSPHTREYHADWPALTEGTFEEEVVDGYFLLRPPRASEVASRLRDRISKGARTSAAGTGSGLRPPSP